MDTDDFEAAFSFLESEPTTPRRHEPSPIQYNEVSLSELLEAELPAAAATTTQLPSSVVDKDMSLPPPGIYLSKLALFEAIQKWALPRGYAFTIRQSKRVPGSFREKVHYGCDCRQQKPVYNSTESYRRKTNSRGTGCQFSVIAVESIDKVGWELKHRPDAKFGVNNHGPSSGAAAHPAHRKMKTEDREMAIRILAAGNYILFFLYK